MSSAFYWVAVTGALVVVLASLFENLAEKSLWSPHYYKHRRFPRSPAHLHRSSTRLWVPLSAEAFSVCGYRPAVTSCVPRPVTNRCQELLTSLRSCSLTPCRHSVCKPKDMRFAQQQRTVKLRHLADVIPQQGDAFQLPQVLAAVHPELPREVDFVRQYRQ